MLHTIIKHARLILAWGAVVAVAALTVSFFLPRYYSAEAQLLIIVRGGTGTDAYTQSKAADLAGENLAQVIRTQDFYTKVMESGSAVNRDRWQGLTERRRRRAWARDVRAVVDYGTGVLSLKVYGLGESDTAALSGAVVNTLVTRGWEYAGSDVSIRVLNSPLVSYLPGRPNFVLNTVVGFVLGFVLSAWWAWRYKRVFGIKI
ncbi:MAG: Wzz/FepE/Etk N-terminal domain-containing protein [bacterium]|nr:Wzz/FepE/Etk N-terminal domain-containing protein [bacterium]